LKSKDEVFHYFKIFKAFVERESVRQIKMVCSDGGGEYKSNEFKRHSEELGLQHNITCPYTPQRNRELPRERIEQSWTWRGACLKQKVCQIIFGLRP